VPCGAGSGVKEPLAGFQRMHAIFVPV